MATSRGVFAVLVTISSLLVTGEARRNSQKETNLTASAARDGKSKLLISFLHHFVLNESVNQTLLANANVLPRLDLALSGVLTQVNKNHTTHKTVTVISWHYR